MRFAKAYVEITNSCDLACPFCPRTRRPESFMGRKAFGKILERLKGKTKLLYFHLMGEPLLHPELEAFLELCRLEGFEANLTTNGGLLPRRSPSLISSRALRQVNVSLHSRTGGGIGTEAYLDGIAEFLREAQAAGHPLVSLRLWNYSSGDDEGKTELRRAVESRFGVSLPENPGRDGFRGIRLGPRAYLNIAETFEWPGLEKPEIGRNGFCRGLRDQIGILVDGTVVPCCLDGQGAIGLGNILEEDLDAILAGERAAALYRGFSERKAVEELCRRCSYRLRFGG